MRNEHTMYETILFDLDGTLLDTLEDLTNATNFALAKFGYLKRSQEEVCSFVGNGIAKLIERAIGEKTQDFLEVLESFKGYYGAHCAEKTKPYEGILPLLKTLKEYGIRTAVVSNKADFAVKSLAKEYFDGLLMQAIGEDEERGIRKKPAPDTLLAVMKELQADPKTTLYVGDSEVDIQTAQNAGIDCLCVTWGFRKREFLEAQGGKLFVDHPIEILEFCQ